MAEPNAKKQDEITKCAICGNGMAHTGTVVFYRVTLETFGLDAGAIQRAHGLELQMGAAAPLAQLLGPPGDIFQQLDEKQMLVCMDCAPGEIYPLLAYADPS